MQHKILIFEDEPIIALDLCNQLNAQGYEVLIATDATEAGMLCALHRPELAILNLHHSTMPDGQGLATMLYAINPLKIIYLSGACLCGEQDMLALEQAHLILHKPFVAKQLKSFLHKNHFAPTDLRT